MKKIFRFLVGSLWVGDLAVIISEIAGRTPDLERMPSLSGILPVSLACSIIMIMVIPPNRRSKLNFERESFYVGLL